MIFIIPLIFGAVAGATGALGIAAGAEGVDKMKQAEEIGEAAERKLRKSQAKAGEAKEKTQELAADYGRLRLEVQAETIGRFVRFCQRLKQRVSYSNSAFLEDLGLTIPQLNVYQEEVNGAVATLQALGAAGTAAGLAAQGAIGTAALFGTASTGTAIGSLSGAAAWNATLAWLGGGSLASGGGGMALGTWVLGGIAVGPALMLGGFVLHSRGEKALTEAHAFAAEVDEAVVKLEAYIDFLKQVQRRISELQMLVRETDAAAIRSLEELEQEVLRNRDFDPKRSRDAQLFQRAALLVKTLSELLKIPVLDKNGNLH
ncbi:MAG: hypothetical protein ACUVSQ_04885, partial [Pseudanabaenaceae cyanobacterium]